MIKLQKFIRPFISLSVFGGVTFGSLFMSAGASYAGEAYVGAWRKGSDAYALYRYNNWTSFTTKWKELNQKNLRLVDMEVETIGNKTRYLGVWRKGSDGYGLYRFDSWSKFTNKWKELAKKNLRLVDIEVEKIGNKTFYYGVWRKGSDAYALYGYDSWSKFTTKWKELAQKNLRLVDIEVEKIGNKTFYYGVWRKGSDAYALYRYDTWGEFTKKWKELGKKNLRLVDVEPVKIGNKTHYFGVWRKGSDAHALYLYKNWSDFTNKWKQLNQKNFRLTDIGIFESTSSVTSGGSSSNSGSGSGSSSSNSFPTLPNYVKLESGTLGNQNYRVIVDFSSIIDGKPTITLPAQFLSTLPTYDGEVLFPDNFCGMKIIAPSRFIWLDKQNKVVDQHPYNYVPESSSVNQMYGDNYYLGGIQFTGPIGACNKNGSGSFDFPFPLTKEGKNPLPNLKLVIELVSDSQIKFLNYDIDNKPLKADKIFKKKSFEKIIDTIKKQFDDSNSKKRLENYDKFVEEVCETSPEKCPYIPPQSPK
ncbi:MAG: hypothetical protein AAFV71_09900 [Cyanobacteria bacterium J06633_8]